MITSADGKRIEGLIYFAETHKQTKFGLLNQTVLVVRSCLFCLAVSFSLRRWFLPACLSCLISQWPPQRALFLFRQVNALDCALYLSSAAQASLARHTDVIPSDRGHPLSFRSSIILLTNTLHLFSWRHSVVAVAIWFAAHPDLLTDTLRPCDKVLSRNPPHQGSFM